MIEITNTTSFKCKKCGNTIELEPSDFDGPEIDTQERNMGYETSYTWENENDCGKCNNSYKMQIHGFEYPEGILNYQEFELFGGIWIEKPTLGIINEYDNNID